MTMLLLICLGLTLAIYITAFHFAPGWLQRWLVRHPAMFMLANLATIPLMVMTFGAGLIAGAINFGSSALFAGYLSMRRQTILGGRS